jgi:catechol 2,3-dioxygenase-like lactoylglutathione lyase family enzyme
VLKTRGLNHVDLGTRDMEATRAFYEDLLGFPLVRADLVEIGDDGRLKHFFFDIGNGQLMGFMSGEDVNGYPKDFDARAGASRSTSGTRTGSSSRSATRRGRSWPTTRSRASASAWTAA